MSCLGWGTHRVDRPAGRQERTEKWVANVEVSRQTYTSESAAQALGEVIDLIDGRWKLVILFHLFGGKVLRFSDLERAIPGISQKMLAQQLRRLEADGLVERTVYPEVPPRVDYRMTAWGQSLCPALDALLAWFERREPAAVDTRAP